MWTKISPNFGRKWPASMGGLSDVRLMFMHDWQMNNYMHNSFYGYFDVNSKFFQYIQSISNFKSFRSVYQKYKFFTYINVNN